MGEKSDSLFDRLSLHIRSSPASNLLKSLLLHYIFIVPNIVLNISY